jgi:hypothetical protein
MQLWLTYEQREGMVLASMDMLHAIDVPTATLLHLPIRPVGHLRKAQRNL